MSTIILPNACDRNALAVDSISSSSSHFISATFKHNGNSNTIYRTPVGISKGQMLNGKGDLFFNEHLKTEEMAAYVGSLRFDVNNANVVHFREHLLDGLRDCAIVFMLDQANSGTFGQTITKLWKATRYDTMRDRIVEAYGTPNDRFVAKAKLNSPPPKIDVAGNLIIPGSGQDYVNVGDTVVFDVIPKLQISILSGKWYITFTLIGIQVLACNQDEMDVARAKMAHERRCSRSRAIVNNEMEQDRIREEQRLAFERSMAERIAVVSEPVVQELIIPVVNPDGIPLLNCIMCLTNHVNCNYQCGHTCACLDCTRDLHERQNPKCPICRLPILVVTPIYLAGYEDVVNE